MIKVPKKEISEHRRSQMRAAQKRWRQRNPERVLSDNARNMARPEYKVWLREWSKSPEQKAKRNKRKERYRKNPKYILDDRIRSAIYRNFRRKRFKSSWEDVLGYSLDDLRIHLERQFSLGMNWENAGEWHIDHIRPVSSFTYSDEFDPEFKLAWSLSNLQPLWATDNLKKSNKRVNNDSP